MRRVRHVAQSLKPGYLLNRIRSHLFTLEYGRQILIDSTGIGERVHGTYSHSALETFVCKTGN